MAEKIEEDKDQAYYDALFAKVNELKTTGNNHIQKNEVQNALICYAKASQELDQKFIDCKNKDIIKQYISLRNQIYGNVSLCFFKKENYEDAKDYSEKILLTDPLNFKSYFRLAQIYKKMQKQKEALENIQVAIEIANDPKYKITKDQLIQCQRELNEIKNLKK